MSKDGQTTVIVPRPTEEMLDTLRSCLFATENEFGGNSKDYNVCSKWLDRVQEACRQS